MFGTVLDAVVGLIFVFFLVSVLCSAIVEALANVFRKRAKYLLRALRDLLDAPPAETQETRVGIRADIGAARQARREENRLYTAALKTPPTPQATADQSPQVDAPWTMGLMRHPLIAAMKQSRASGGSTRNPSYIPARTFAIALIDLLVTGAQGNTTLQKIKSAIAALQPESLRDALLALLRESGDDIDRFRDSLERWYDAEMDRISGAYKRWAKRWVIVFGLAAALLLNIDAVQVGRALYSDQPLREAVAASATNGTLCPQGGSFDETRRCTTEALEKLAAPGLPVGWPVTWPTDLPGWLSRILGLLITAGAATFGAPFWFDLLNRFGSLRNAGARPRSTTSDA